MQEMSGHESCTLLEERDYIGLSNISSASSALKEDADSVQDSDLGLELGLGLGLPSDCRGATTRKDSQSKKRSYSEVADDARVSWHAGPFSSDGSSQDSAADDPPPAKVQVVGWPPVCSYRRQTLPKLAEMFVKVNMDGMTVGRKIDLSAYSSYESLLRALEEMFFQPSSSRESDLKHLLRAKESDFVLTYEDKEGDWMLVGDVPWSMFAAAVRRLRITRASEANGTVPRRPQMLKAKF